jgi:16S rRNA (guanine527-N7)-methyltransferase
MTPQAALERGLAELGLALPADAPGRLLQYLELLAKWNRTYNLTAIRDPIDMVSHHLLDSLAVIKHLPAADESPALADVGSGGGLPGIPLAIARPQWRVSLADSSAKKTAFLRQAAIELALPNVEVHHGRVETWRPARPFAIVISRAFADLSAFIAASRHLLVPQGILAAMKGAMPSEELASLPPGCDCSRVIELQVPLLKAQRHLVLCHLGA